MLSLPFCYPGTVSSPALVVIRDGGREFGSVYNLTLHEGETGGSGRMLEEQG